MRSKLMVAVVGLAALTVGCSDEGAATSAVVTDDPVATFAPLISLSSRERTFPVSTEYFFRNSGLEWAGGPCFIAEADIAAGLHSRPLTGSPIPPMHVRKLGKDPAYRYRPLKGDCRTPRDQSYFATQHTRPFDSEDRPPGLFLDEGFNLDILTDYQAGHKRTAEDGSLLGVPAYYAEERAMVGSRSGIRISYWLLFGRGETLDAKGEPVKHEGDWERIDVTLRKQSGNRFVPLNVRFHDRSDMTRVPWTDVSLTDRSHPTVYLAPRSHTPHPQTSTTDGRTSWPTWRDLRDVTREVWYGYGGGWGAFADTAAESGPAGPSPYNLATPRDALDNF